MTISELRTNVTATNFISLQFQLILLDARFFYFYFAEFPINKFNFKDSKFNRACTELNDKHM